MAVYFFRINMSRSSYIVLPPSPVALPLPWLLPSSAFTQDEHLYMLRILDIRKQSFLKSTSSTIYHFIILFSVFAKPLWNIIYISSWKRVRKYMLEKGRDFPVKMAELINILLAFSYDHTNITSKLQNYHWEAPNIYLSRSPITKDVQKRPCQDW